MNDWEKFQQKLKNDVLSIVKDNPDGLTIDEIRHILSKNLGANFTFYEIAKILEDLQADCKVQELFDDEVTLEDRWYLRT